VSKRTWSRYVSGPSRFWTKSKCANWKRTNADRHRLFEIDKRTEITERELRKKREELRRVRERLQDPHLGPGITRELRKHVEILERELGELERK
jgi:hypothetical protein